jgi:hypothetical protein
MSTPTAGRSVADEGARSSDAAEFSFASAVTSVLNRGALGGPQLTTAVELVRDDPAAFGRWLTDAVNDAKTVEAVVARSYWHPNGFAKLVLHTSADPEFKLRMHVWPESEAPARGEPNPHSHRWEFASTVLTGQGVVVPEYREAAEGGDRFDRYRYGTSPDVPEALVVEGPVRLVKMKAPRVSRGDIYACGTGVIHTLEPLGRDLTATVVVQGPRRVHTTAVFRVPENSREQSNRPLSVVDFRQLVTGVVNKVCGCSSPR